MQLLDSDWTANILVGLDFRAQENGLMWVFALLVWAQLGTRLTLRILPPRVVA